MKKIIFFVVLALFFQFIIFALEETITFSEEKYMPSSYDVDREVNENAYSTNNWYEEHLEQNFRNQPFQIIGWTRNGLIAYKDRVSGEAGDIWSLVICNLINDEIIYSNSHNSLFDDANEFIVKQRWNEALQTYGFTERIEKPLENIYQTEYSKFPYNDFDCWFNFSLKFYSVDDITEINISPFFAYKGQYNLDNWELIIINARQKKIVASDNGRNDLPVPPAGRKIMGYLKSPYENRLAIIVLSYYLFHETNSVSVSLYGCNMDVGFK